MTDNDSTPFQWHKFTYAVWPSPMPAATYPMLVPDHVVMYVREGTGANELLPDVEEGFRAMRVGHSRYQCHPPCKVWP